MKIDDRIKLLYDKNQNEAYKELQMLEVICDNSDECYMYFEEFLDMLRSESFYIKVRGIRLICKLAKWDHDNKIDNSINEILTVLDDKRPIAVRQSLSALEELVENKKGLRKVIKEKLENLDTKKYKDSMQGLVEKDINHLILKIEYEENA